MRKVAAPLLIENILRTTLTTVDVFMLSFFNQKAVAAVGLVNQFVFFIQLMYLMVASGASILLAQYLGAGKSEVAEHTALGSFALGTGFAVCLSLGLALGAPWIIGCYSLEPQVRDYAIQFLVIYASGSVFVAFSMLQSTILRVHGETKAPMFINMATNVVNLGGNSLSLFGWFGFPVLGVAGVAWSTVVSQGLACVALNFVIRRKKEIHLRFRNLSMVEKKTYGKILSVGIPTAGENISYNIAQIVNMGFISSLGTAAMAAFVYLTSFLRYIFIGSITIGNATQIKVGWWVGQGQEDLAYRRALRYFAVGLGISVVMVTLVNLFQGTLFRLFTQDPKILGLIGSVLLVSLVLEPGRNFNVILIPALKGAGDVQFPVLVGMVFMWGIGVLGSWFFGIVLGWGLVGIYIALCTDEWTRGLIMFWRWKSGRWKGRSFLTPDISSIELKAVTPAVEDE